MERSTVVESDHFSLSIFSAPQEDSNSEFSDDNAANANMQAAGTNGAYIGYEIENRDRRDVMAPPHQNMTDF